MFRYLLKEIQKNLADASNAIKYSIKYLTPWDYTLIAATVVTPLVLGLPWYSVVLSTSAVSVCLMLPRKEVIKQNRYEEDSEDIQRVSHLLSNILDKPIKPLCLLDKILAEKKSNKDLNVRVVITTEGQRILILPADLSCVNDAQLAVVLEHELAHLKYNDPIAATYTRRIYFANVLLSSLMIQNQLLMTLGWSGAMFLLKQASSRYREYRADRYAFQNSVNGNCLDQAKIASLKAFIELQNEQALQMVNAQAHQDNNPLMAPTAYLINSYLNPQTSLECIINELLNLVQTHPSNKRRFNF